MSTELVLEVEAGPPAVPDRRDLVDAFLAGKKPTTVREYQKDLAAFASFLGMEGFAHTAVYWFLKLDAGKANEVVLGWRNHQAERGLSSSTINRRLAAVRSLTKLARTLGRIPWVVEIQGVKAEPRRDMRGPNAEGLKRLKRVLRSKATHPRTRALFFLLYGLGLRRAEAAGLGLEDVDFAGAKLHITGKGRREKTAVEMGPEVSRALAEWVVVRGHGPGKLFPGRAGKGEASALNLGTVNRLMEELGEQAGLPGKLRPHGARHAAVTEFFRRKKTVAEVQIWARHAKPETTMRYHDAKAETSAELTRELDESLG